MEKVFGRLLGRDSGQFLTDLYKVVVQGWTSNRFDTSWRSSFLIDMALSGLGLGYFSGLCNK